MGLVVPRHPPEKHRLDRALGAGGGGGEPSAASSSLWLPLGHRATSPRLLACLSPPPLELAFRLS